MRLLPHIFLCLHLISSKEFDVNLARKALEYSATAYAVDPTACLLKQNATLVANVRKPCDYLGNEISHFWCWGIVTLVDDWIVVAFRGTRSKIQLITELLETMSEPKKKLKVGGSVQHYFYTAVKAIWNETSAAVKKLKNSYPDKKILFTGHSLGGALASLASTVFADHHPHIRNKIFLITFGQPRVGNYKYAQIHDALVNNSWRIVHKRDLVAHLPACVHIIFNHSCEPFFNHGPYHHGTEVWFPTNMTNSALYTICNGFPPNEDQSCSNQAWVYDIADHVVYFEHNVSEYGRNQCIDPK